MSESVTVVARERVRFRGAATGLVRFPMVAAPVGCHAHGPTFRFMGGTTWQ